MFPPTERSARRIRAVAYVGLLAFTPVTAFTLELGEAAIRSALGQSLIVHIPYRLAAGEELTPACIGLAPAARTNRGLPTYSRASRIAVTPTHIEIFGDARVLDPLIGLTVDVRCDTAPHFARRYELFVDPPARLPTTLAATAEVAPAQRAAPARASVSARARGQTGGVLAQGQTYTVARGDTLSGIAARVGNRATSIRETADAIFAANPEAFGRGDRNLLEAERTITIPVMTPAATLSPVPMATTPAPVRDEATLAPVVGLAPASTSATAPRSDEAAPAVLVPRAVDAAPAAASVVQPNATPVASSRDLPAEAPNLEASGRTWLWLGLLLALGAAVLLAAPLLFIRRRRQAGGVQDRVDRPASHPRQLVDPAAGFDVVEGRLGRTQTSVSLAPVTVAAATSVDSTPVAPAEPVSSAHDSGSTATVDLDVGAPVAADARIDWSENRTAAAEPIDDEQHTLTIVELDTLRQDYETEHTLTQGSSQALREALADLEVTRAARAAAETATLEMPRQTQAESDDRSHDSTTRQKRA